VVEAFAPISTTKRTTPISWWTLTTTVVVATALLPLMVAKAQVLDENWFRLATIAADICINITYTDPAPEYIATFDSFVWFNEEPDEAAVASRDGTCYGVFRGTVGRKDWVQNLKPLTEDICGREGCCQARTGFVEAYNAKFRGDFEAALLDCVDTNCPTTRNCVVLSGYSQGAAIALVAAIILSGQIDPIGITFGQPMAIIPDCPYVNSSNWYRLVNTRPGTLGLVYDPIPSIRINVPIRVNHVGYLIIVSDDPSGAASFGLDSRHVPRPFDKNYYQAHSMLSRKEWPSLGYMDRLLSYQAKGMYPLSVDGFGTGYWCREDDECQSGNCRRTFISPLTKTCA
jgi:hypothetical protein